MMNRQHGVPFNWPPLVPAGKRKVETAIGGAIYLPGDIDNPIYPGKYRAGENPELLQWLTRPAPISRPSSARTPGSGPARRGRDCGHAGVPQARRAADHHIQRRHRPADRSRSSRHRTRNHCPLASTRLASGNRNRRDDVSGAAWARTAQARRCRARGDIVAAPAGVARRSPAAHRWRCESWWKKCAVPMAMRIAPARQRMPPIVSCPSWPAILQASRKPRGHCSPTTGGDSSVSSPAGPTIFATTSSSSPSAIAPSRKPSNELTSLPESEKRVKSTISSEDISALPRTDDAEQHPAVVVGTINGIYSDK